MSRSQHHLFFSTNFWAHAPGSLELLQENPEFHGFGSIHFRYAKNLNANRGASKWSSTSQQDHHCQVEPLSVRIWYQWYLIQLGFCWDLSNLACGKKTMLFQTINTHRKKTASFFSKKVRTELLFECFKNCMKFPHFSRGRDYITFVFFLTKWVLALHQILHRDASFDQILQLATPVIFASTPNVEGVRDLKLRRWVF